MLILLITICSILATADVFLTYKLIEAGKEESNALPRWLYKKLGDKAFILHALFWSALIAVPLFFQPIGLKIGYGIILAVLAYGVRNNWNIYKEIKK